MSVRRIKVVISKMVGNRLNSSGLFADTATSSTITASTMLKVNRISSSAGGSGRITIARIHSITSGTPRLPPRSSARNDLVVFAIQFKHLFGNGNMSVQGRARLCALAPVFHL